MTIQSNIAAKPVLRAEQRVFKNRRKSLPGLLDVNEKLTDGVFCTFQPERISGRTSEKLDMGRKKSERKQAVKKIKTVTYCAIEMI